ncbi:hypothetical protein HCAG_01954 [Histoplasma mississippiense (nom. inval.)]|uniref:hypothetical protein n=1 Tax=Ajellomyces capsulatus (strain NAm1 / WU24) TaxID=2059318 RepID=UPI000157B712|nr:hypothetical protein HCAG_01954 [Histoplasma mississippiense (nom. inval.)]EDN04089.1 hypothetical protein HCAG_01954 [Histoplasma mississippiense (nom. inval.)]
MTALFNFQSLLLVIVLIICTSAYAHSIMPGIMDRNQNGLFSTNFSLLVEYVQLFRDILEMRPGWGTAKPVRQFVLFDDGGLDFSEHGNQIFEISA